MAKKDNRKITNVNMTPVEQIYRDAYEKSVIQQWLD